MSVTENLPSLRLGVNVDFRLIDYKSPEKEILLDIFKDIPMMDNWIASIIENYIYCWEEGKEDLYNNYYKCLTKYGIKDGEYKQWWNNGQLFIQTTYKDGEYDGEFKQWWDNGKLWIETTYKDGEYDGEFKQWWDNGKLWIETTYKNGEINGEFKCWNHRGELTMNVFYIDGMKMDN